MIDIKELRALAANIDNFNVTKHMTQRFRERGIKLRDVQNAIMNGEIIEQYPDDFPFPSCLVLAFLGGTNPLHTCIGLGEGKLWAITAYFPNLGEWENDFKTRKAAD